MLFKSNSLVMFLPLLGGIEFFVKNGCGGLGFGVDYSVVLRFEILTLLAFLGRGSL